MSRFYNAMLSKGLTPAAALRQAEALDREMTREQVEVDVVNGGRAPRRFRQPVHRDATKDLWQSPESHRQQDDHGEGEERDSTGATHPGMPRAGRGPRAASFPEKHLRARASTRKRPSGQIVAARPGRARSAPIQAVTMRRPPISRPSSTVSLLMP